MGLDVGRPESSAAEQAARRRRQQAKRAQQMARLREDLAALEKAVVRMRSMMAEASIAAEDDDAGDEGEEVQVSGKSRSRSGCSP